MERYKVKLSITAKNNIKSIIRYSKDELLVTSTLASGKVVVLDARSWDTR